jgi:hypothetical protein
MRWDEMDWSCTQDVGESGEVRDVARHAVCRRDVKKQRRRDDEHLASWSNGEVLLMQHIPLPCIIIVVVVKAPVDVPVPHAQHPHHPAPPRYPPRARRLTESSKALCAYVRCG